MQQYRVNFRLLIGLAVGAVVSTGAVYFLWKFQIERRSDTLIAEAENARAAGDLPAAVKLYSQYVQIKPTDLPQRVKFAEVCADLAEKYDASMEDRGASVRAIEATLRDLPNEKDLRKRLATIYGRFNLTQDALQHLDFVLDDPEARVMRAALLIRAGNLDQAIDYSLKVVGYDSATDKFDPAAPDAVPDDASTYLNLALMLRGKDRNELADRVMEQCLAANPNSAKAYMAHGQYSYRIGEIERGIDDFAQAYKLSPEDVEVLAAVANQAALDKEFDKAKEYINKGKALHPQNVRFYQLAAYVASAQGDHAGALAELKEGQLKIPPPANFDLLLGKADMQLRADDHKGVSETIEELKAAAVRPELVEWYRARLLMSEEKWYQANELLTKLRPLLAGEPRFANDLNYFLGMTYLKLGKNELALRAFDEVLQKMPDNEPAKFGKQQAAALLGRTDEVVAIDPLDQAINAELKKPKAEQKWADIEAMVGRVAEQRGWDELTRKLAWGDILLARKEFADARKLAAELYANAPEDRRVMRLALEGVRLDTSPGQGPAQALQMLERLNPKDEPQWRLYRADVLIGINDERTKPQLASLLTNLDDWTLSQKVALWNGMADRYLSSSLRMMDDARRCLTLVAENQPDDLQSRMRLFALALEGGDDAEIKAAQDAVRKVVGSESDASWLYTEARRRLALVRRGRMSMDALPEIRQMLARALEKRPEWHELHALNAEIELLGNNFAAALKHLEKAEDLGRLSASGLVQFIRLLAADGQLVRAAQLVERLPESSRQPLLGNLYTELLFRTNKIGDAVQAARAQAEASPDNALLQYRYGELLARSTDQPGVTPEQKKSLLGEAVQQVSEAVKLQPELADGWYSLVMYNALAGDADKAQQALRDMQLALSGDNLQLVLAKCYDAMGRWFDAEPLYRAMYEADPDNMERVQQLAAFYVGSGYRQADMREKASPLINKILRAGAEGKLPPGDRNLQWARRMGAKMLAGTGDYQQLKKAEQLLASNSQDGSLPLEDRLEMAQILAPRPEPESRLRAIRLLEDVDRSQPLSEAASLILGNLYFSMGEWNQVRDHMLRSIGRYPKSVPLRVRFAQMALSRNNQAGIQLAEEQVRHLRELAPNARETFELVTRVAIRTGREKDVQTFLVNAVPRNPDPKAIKDEQVPLLDLYASLFVELKDLDRAEQIHQLLAKRDDPNRIFVLAAFLGTYRDPAKAFELLDAQYAAGKTAESIRVGVQILRNRREDVGDRFDAQVGEWLDRALNANLGSVPLLLAKAEFFEIQEKYAEAIEIYRGLLASPGMTGFARAATLNNLSYLMALSGGGTAEVDPLKLVEEAAQILGPTADILDTRAVVLISRNRYDEAIQDLELSVRVEPTAAKYFHKALAHLGGGQNRAAIDSWTKAEELGLDRKSLNHLEHDRYDKAAAEIEKLRKPGAMP